MPLRLFFCLLEAILQAVGDRQTELMQLHAHGTGLQQVRDEGRRR